MGNFPLLLFSLNVKKIFFLPTLSAEMRVSFCLPTPNAERRCMGLQYSLSTKYSSILKANITAVI